MTTHEEMSELDVAAIQAHRRERPAWLGTAEPYVHAIERDNDALVAEVKRLWEVIARCDGVLDGAHAVIVEQGWRVRQLSEALESAVRAWGVGQSIDPGHARRPPSWIRTARSVLEACGG